MTTIFIVLAAAAVLSFAVMARPAVAIPGALASTLAWWVAAGAAWELSAPLITVLGAGMGALTGGCAIRDAGRVASADCARSADEQAEEVVR